MQTRKDYSFVMNIMLISAAFVIVVAGVKTASTLIILILLSVVIATICEPIFSKLSNYFHSIVSLVIVLTLIISVFISLSVLVSSSVQEFIIRFPMYQKEFIEKNTQLFSFLHSQGIEFNDKAILNMINLDYVMQFAVGALKGFGGLLTKGLVIMLLVAFMLLEKDTFVDKLNVILKDKKRIENVNHIFSSIKRFLLIKTITSFFTGLIIYFILLYKGLDFALLWAVVTFALNFVPTIGSIVAAVPAVILAFLQLGIQDAVIIALGFLVVNVAIGNITEPKLMGRGLGLSTLAVFVSLMFWGWVLGPIGMLLAVPLAVMAKIILASFEQTRWIAILLDSKVTNNENKINT